MQYNVLIEYNLNIDLILCIYAHFCKEISLSIPLS